MTMIYAEALDQQAYSTTTIQSSVSLRDGEDDWLEGLRSGDNASYVRLIRDNSDKLLRVARRYLNDDEAQDAVQEAFIKAYQGIGSFRASSCISTWLHRIVVNCCVSRLRRTARKLEVSLDTMPTDVLEINLGSICRTVSPDSQLEQTELLKFCQKCIQKLPVDYRMVLLLRDVEGFTGDETANLLGISANLAKVRLHRARRLLHRTLSPHIATEINVKQ